MRVVGESGQELVGQVFAEGLGLRWAPEIRRGDQTMVMRIPVDGQHQVLQAHLSKHLAGIAEFLITRMQQFFRVGVQV